MLFEIGPQMLVLRWQLQRLAQMRGVRQQTVSAQHKRALAALKTEIEMAA